MERLVKEGLVLKTALVEEESRRKWSEEQAQSAMREVAILRHKIELLHQTAAVPDVLATEVDTPTSQPKVPSLRRGSLSSIDDNCETAHSTRSTCKREGASPPNESLVLESQSHEKTGAEQTKMLRAGFKKASKIRTQESIDAGVITVKGATNEAAACNEEHDMSSSSEWSLDSNSEEEACDMLDKDAVRNRSRLPE